MIAGMAARCGPAVWKGRLMRWVIGALVGLAFAPSAFAGDFDVLRGPQSVGPATFTRWSGFYAGGQFSYSDASTDFSGATTPLVAFSLRELALENDDHPSQWPVLGKTTTASTGYGGFVGYNTQWQDLILGFEGNYTRSSFSTTAPDSPLSRVVTAQGNTYSVTLTGSGRLQLTDYGTLRARAGWIFNNFLPYGFVGVAIGRDNYSVTSLVFGQQDPSSPPVVPCNTTLAPNCVDYSFANSAAKDPTLMYGFSVGGGLDFALTQNIFLRGEYEYVRFAPIAGIVAAISTARIGAGIKF
jgi:outer membrane immunogenic protein